LEQISVIWTTYNNIILIVDWNADPEVNFNWYLPNWDKNIRETGAKKKYEIYD